LLSRAPEAPMLDHYTTGLRRHRETPWGFINFNVTFCRLGLFHPKKVVKEPSRWVVIELDVKRGNKS
ncbi:MAG: hypothetical protein ACQCN6_02595, partial [Candidatus Bathyarchaeia archaeon]